MPLVYGTSIDDSVCTLTQILLFFVSTDYMGRNKNINVMLVVLSPSFLVLFYKSVLIK